MRPVVVPAAAQAGEADRLELLLVGADLLSIELVGVVLLRQAVISTLDCPKLSISGQQEHLVERLVLNASESSLNGCNFNLANPPMPAVLSGLANGPQCHFSPRAFVVFRILTPEKKSNGKIEKRPNGVNGFK